MNQPSDFGEDLRRHLALCHELLQMTEHEHRLLRTPESHYPVSEFQERRRRVLPRLETSLRQLQSQRDERQRPDHPSRPRAPETSDLIRRLQEMIMKILTLDRENEQALLRRGFGAASPKAPPLRQSPHFVSELYRRHSQF